MSKYIKYCNTLQDFFDLEYYSPRITHINTTEECIYNYIGNENYYEEIKYKIPLSFEILEDGTVGSTFSKVVEYSLNGDTWKIFDSNVSVKEGDFISFRGDNNQYGDNGGFSSYYFNTTCRFNVFGNIMSLIKSTNFYNLNSIPSNYCFAFLFYNCNKLISAQNLILSITTLTYCCYWNIFGNCSSLINPPSLPATTLAQGCYSSMFENCTSLITTPELPATTLAERCYFSMFSNCKSLTIMPKLIATNLASECYGNMFKDCTSLVNIYYLPATTLVESCYENMFMNCININITSNNNLNNLSEIFFKYDNNNKIQTIRLIREYTGLGLKEGKEIVEVGYISEDELLDGYKLTSLIEELINLNATILSDIEFFLPATTLADNCYYSMFKGCTSLTTTPNLRAITLCNSCYKEMFSGCTNLTNVSELPATTLADSCYDTMFIRCTSLTAAPELPAKILTECCYRQMFKYCDNLNYIKCLATDISANGCLAGWTDRVSPSGTFVKDSSMNDWPTGVNGIPSGWTVENFNTNYLKLGENTIGHNNLSSETGNGTIIEVGSGFDISDLTNNPPIVYYSDGTTVSGGIPSRWTNTTTFEIYGAYHIVLTFNSSTNPTQYTFTKTSGGGSDK